MKYYLKYLPVEGDVKEGDYWTREGSKHAIKAINVHKEMPGLTAKYSHVITKGDYIKHIGGKLAKLFLCTSEVHVGDRVNYLHQHGTIEETTVEAAHFDIVESDGCRIHIYDKDLPNVYEIIGQIAPVDDWLRQDMILELHQVQIYSNPNAIPLQELSAMPSWFYNQSRLRYRKYIERTFPNEDWIKYVDTYVEVQCPTCKRFH